MSDDKKKYICKLPTNGFNTGDEAFLTDAEVANFNGGEEIPRFVLADEVSAADAPVEEKASEETPGADVTPETTPAPASSTGSGEYVPEEKKEGEDTTPPASTGSDTTPSTEGVE